MKEETNLTYNEIEFLKQSRESWITKYYETKAEIIKKVKK